MLPTLVSLKLLHLVWFPMHFLEAFSYRNFITFPIVFGIHAPRPARKAINEDIFRCFQTQILVLFPSVQSKNLFYIVFFTNCLYQQPGYTVFPSSPVCFIISAGWAIHRHCETEQKKATSWVWPIMHTLFFRSLTNINYSALTIPQCRNKNICPKILSLRFSDFFGIHKSLWQLQSPSKSLKKTCQKDCKK